MARCRHAPKLTQSAGQAGYLGAPNPQSVYLPGPHGRFVSDTRPSSARPLRIHFFMLTDTVASEHMYGERLQNAMAEFPVEFVDDWREADVVHLFEVNFLTRDALSAMRYLELYRVLRSDVPVVVSTDDLYFTGDPSLTSRPRLYWPNNRLQRWLLTRCDTIIAISESVKRRIEESISATHIRVVHHGVDERYFDAPETAADPFVLHVSLAAPRKNPRAIREVAERLNARFVIAGGGWQQYVPADLNGGSVEVTGYVSEDELVDLYGRAGVFYFPTLHEGFGLPLLEAMASGTAVVTSDVYSVPEVTGGAALLHDPHDVGAHLESISELLADESRRERLERASRRRAREFRWEETADKTLTVYRSVLEE